MISGKQNRARVLHGKRNESPVYQVSSSFAFCAQPDIKFHRPLLAVLCMLVEEKDISVEVGGNWEFGERVIITKEGRGIILKGMSEFETEIKLKNK